MMYHRGMINFVRKPGFIIGASFVAAMSGAVVGMAASRTSSPASVVRTHAADVTVDTTSTTAAPVVVASPVTTPTTSAPVTTTTTAAIDTRVSQLENQVHALEPAPAPVAPTTTTIPRKETTTTTVDCTTDQHRYDVGCGQATTSTTTTPPTTTLQNG